MTENKISLKKADIKYLLHINKRYTCNNLSCEIYGTIYRQIIFNRDINEIDDKHVFDDYLIHNKTIINVKKIVCETQMDVYDTEWLSSEKIKVLYYNIIKNKDILLPELDDETNEYQIQIYEFNNDNEIKTICDENNMKKISENLNTISSNEKASSTKILLTVSSKEIIIDSFKIFDFREMINKPSFMNISNKKTDYKSIGFNMICLIAGGISIFNILK